MAAGSNLWIGVRAKSGVLERIPALIALVLLAAFFTGEVAAQSDNRADDRLFTAYGISVDVRAGSTAEARRQAIAEAERRGFDILLAKILPADDLALVPRPDAAALRFLLRGFEVANEKSSRTRYLADITIAFDGQRIKSYLRQIGVAFTEIAPKPVILLPVYKKAGGDMLWEENNPWKQAWIDGGARNRLVHYRFGIGDFADQAAVSTHAASFGVPPGRLKPFLDRNGGSDVLLAIAEMDQDPVSGHEEMRFRFRRGFDAPLESGRIQAMSGDDEEALLRRAAVAIMNRLDIRWRDITLISAGEVGAMSMVVAVEDIADWVSVRRKLSNIPIIQELTVNQLALPESEITISYIGGRDRLELSLAQEGLALQENTRGLVLVPLGDEGSESGEVDQVRDVEKRGGAE